mmetsp:Transcript_19701/g.31911  ORF Transcript_19701/g.31911 Transcript_19701/m.31911 type:complete len:258 (+) Transcript_19701:51-824(+)
MRDAENQRFALMSDNSIPLQTFHAVYCALMADPRSVINACAPGGQHHQPPHASLERFPPDFPTWLNVSVWRKSSQWWVLNRRHAAIVSRDEETLRHFETKCFKHYKDDVPGAGTTRSRQLSQKSCYGDEHYFATSLAVRGEGGSTTCSEGVTYVNWDSYRTGHPRTFASERDVTRGDFFSEKRVDQAWGTVMCGGRTTPPSGQETAECSTHGAEHDWGWGKDAQPGFGECLFMRKIADNLATAVVTPFVKFVKQASR